MNWNRHVYFLDLGSIREMTFDEIPADHLEYGYLKIISMRDMVYTAQHHLEILQRN